MQTFILAGALLAISVAGPGPAVAAPAATCDTAKTSAFGSVSFLVGTWGGAGKAEGTAGSGTDSFRFELGCRVLVRHAHSSYAGDGTTAPSSYDGMLIVYPDPSAPAGLRADSFDSGGHVIRYALVGGTAPNVAQFLSEGPTVQPTFRLTYARHESDLEVTFEMALPGSATFTTVAHGIEHPQPA